MERGYGDTKWNHVWGKGLACRHCGKPAMHTTFLCESLAECEFCIKHLCGLCEKPHPEVKVHDGINCEYRFDKRKRCPSCTMCITCGVSKVPDREEITHDREIRLLHVHTTVRYRMKWLVDRTCEECLLANPHWKALVENPINLTYRLPEDFFNVKAVKSSH